MNHELRRILETVDYQITSGSEFLWSCFPESWMMDFRSKSGAEGSIVVGGAVTYQVTIYDNETDDKFVWTHPAHRDAYFAEGQERSIDLSVEQVVESFDDIIQKIRPSTDLEFELDNETFQYIAMSAHNADMTLNQFIKEILAQAIEEAEAKTKADEDR